MSVSYTHLDVYKRQAQKCLKETESKDRELKTIKGIVRNNNYSTNIVAVSYTHLDVYKRQPVKLRFFSGCESHTPGD